MFGRPRKPLVPRFNPLRMDHPLPTAARVALNFRGDCSACHRTNVPCRRLGPAISTMLACAECTMLGRV